MKTILTAIRALVFAGGFITVWTWAALEIRRRYDPVLQFVFPDWIEMAGIILIAAGAALGLTCVGVFVIIGKGTAAPFDPPRKFVAVGPYKYVRNPMYIGALLVILGFGFYINSLAVLIFGLPWILFALLFVIFYEEPALRKKFGEEYRTYCDGVNRWVPRFP